MIKICPNCNIEFECTEDENCACMKVKTNPEKLEVVRNRYNACLCLNCLQTLCGEEKNNDLQE
ncbi:MAG: hypothetical protein GX879_05720 [Bacteroidales bacterium]|nr:hypothetical protein [Bacteroidales bacterium]